jgi:hypothetical protein
MTQEQSASAAFEALIADKANKKKEPQPPKNYFVGINEASPEAQERLEKWLQIPGLKEKIFHPAETTTEVIVESVNELVSESGSKRIDVKYQRSDLEITSGFQFDPGSPGIFQGLQIKPGDVLRISIDATNKLKKVEIVTGTAKWRQRLRRLFTSLSSTQL